MENGDYVVAIDLGTNTVATVVGTRGEGGKVRIIDCEISPVQGVVRSEIKNVELVAQSIKRTIEAIEARQQITIREAYAGISGQHIRCVKYPYYVFVGRDGEIREEDVQKLHESMGNVQAPDGETIIQIIPQNYIVDDEETMNPVGAFGNKLEAVFNFVLGDNNAVSRVKRALQKVEIRQAGLFLNAVASAEAVATEDEKEEGVAVVDIGGGTTEIACISLGGIVCSESINVAGDVFTEDIQTYIRQQHNMRIGERTAEDIKIAVGAALSELDEEPEDFEVTGPNILTSLPSVLSISYSEMAYALEKSLVKIDAAIMKVLEMIPPELYADIAKKGVYLAGGGALLKGLDRRLYEKTNIPFHVADDPLRAVARGTGIALKNIGRFSFLMK